MSRSGFRSSARRLPPDPGRPPTVLRAAVGHRGSAKKQYAAKLLYQYEAVRPRLRGKRRLCEESTIVIQARSAREALRIAKRHARRRLFTFRTVDGVRVGFQFIGVRDLMHLGIECEP